MKEYFETIGKVIKISDIPDEMYGGALPVARNKKSLMRKMTEAEYLEDTSEPVAKVAKTSDPTSSGVPPQQEASEDLLLQKQLEMEAALKRQEALIAQLMNK